MEYLIKENDLTILWKRMIKKNYRNKYNLKVYTLIFLLKYQSHCACTNANAGNCFPPCVARQCNICIYNFTCVFL